MKEGICFIFCFFSFYVLREWDRGWKFWAVAVMEVEVGLVVGAGKRGMEGEKESLSSVWFLFSVLEKLLSKEEVTAMEDDSGGGR